MAQSVTGNLKITASASENVANGLGTGALSPSVTANLQFLNGAGANAANYQFSSPKNASLTASTPVTLTLSALTDDLNRSVPFSKVRVFAFTNLSTVDGQFITLGGAAANPWVGPFGTTTKVYAGGTVVFAAPLATAYAVAAGTSDQLKMDPGGNTQPYSLFLLGE